MHDADVQIAPKTETTVNKLKNPHWVGNVCKSVHDYVYDRVKGGEMAVMLGMIEIPNARLQPMSNTVP